MKYCYYFRIYPNKSQQIILKKTFGCVRFVYNYFLNKRNEYYKENKTILTFSEMSRELTKLKKELVWLQEPDKFSLQNTLRDLDKAFTYFFKSQKGEVEYGFPKFKKKTGYQSYHTNSRHLKIKNNKVFLPKVGYVKIKQTKELNGNIINAYVSYKATGKYFISLTCEIPDLPKLEKTNLDVGIDFGVKTLLTFSNGNKIENPLFWKKDFKKLKRLQKNYQRKEKDSKRRQKAIQKYAKEWEKIVNKRKDFYQKLTTTLVRDFDDIYIETLAIQELRQKNRKESPSLEDSPWGLIIKMLSYKSEWYGKSLIKVDRFFPSTQLCSNCGYRCKTASNLKVREWYCPNCLTLLNRDTNAAINILKEGRRIKENREGPPQIYAHGDKNFLSNK